MAAINSGSIERVSGHTGEYAGFWKRFVAYVIDAIALWIVFAVLYETTHQVAGVIVIPVVWLYFASMESSARQATLGKMAMGLVVTDDKGNRISFGRATARYFCKYLSSIFLGAGYIMAAFTARKQALHDKMVGTLVVDK